MVKFVERSENEHKTLVEITEEMFGRKDTDEWNLLGVITVINNGKPTRPQVAISVFPSLRSILVYDSNYLDRAIRLAEAYESRIKEEFTLIKYLKD